MRTGYLSTNPKKGRAAKAKAKATSETKNEDPGHQKVTKRNQIRVYEQKRWLILVILKHLLRAKTLLILANQVHV